MTKTEYQSLMTQVSEFGQIPSRIFLEKHPQRTMRLVSLASTSNVKNVSEAKTIALITENERLNEEL